MATGDNTASVPFPRLSQTRREGIPHVPGTTKSWPRRGAGARIIAKEHGLTPAGDAQEIRPSTPLTIGLPRYPARTRAGFPCFARVRHGWGRVPSLPRGLRCLHGQLISLTAARRLPAAGPYSPRYSIPPRDVTVTRHHQGFTGVHPSQPFPHL